MTWYWFDTMGANPLGPARGTWEGDTLLLRVTTAGAEGRYTYRFHGDDQYDFRIENSFDGGRTFVKFMEGAHRRSGGGSGR